MLNRTRIQKHLQEREIYIYTYTREDGGFEETTLTGIKLAAHHSGVVVAVVVVAQQQQLLG